MRNNPCPCQSGKKYKKCCMYIQQGWTDTEEGWISYLEIRRRREQAEAKNDRGVAKVG